MKVFAIVDDAPLDQIRKSPKCILVVIIDQHLRRRPVLSAAGGDLLHFHTRSSNTGRPEGRSSGQTPRQGQTGPG
jgi:hypothetical protein